MTPPRLPSHVVELAAVVLSMGVRHGFDPDHLAAIDAMTRYNARDQPIIAKLAGVLFSLGHGLVVIAVAVGVATLAREITLPGWVDAAGTWLALGILVALALANARSALTTKSRQFQFVGMRTSLFARLLHVTTAAGMVTVGVIFALSFETISQASLFAMVASGHGAWPTALALAFLFVVGMIIADGVNGWFIAKLIRRSDHQARIASRIMALSVSGISLIVATLGIASQLSPAIDRWQEGKATWFGLTVVAVVLLSFFVGQMLTRRAEQVGIIEQ